MRLTARTRDSHSAREDAAQALLRETNSLVSLPEVCLKLRALLNDPHHTSRQVCNIIRHDPALCSRILRIVNSAHFGLGSPVMDIARALALLGEQALHNLVIVTAVVQSMDPAMPPGFDLNRFWKGSIFSAVLAANMAEELCPEQKDELFVTGLLLNLGKLPLYHREPALFLEVQRLSRERACEEVEIERELLGFDHAEVGAALARAWNFPDLQAEIIGGHHDLPRVPGSLSARIATLAGALAEALDAEGNPEALQVLEDGDSAALEELAGLALDSPVFAEILERSFLNCRQVFDAFFGQANGR